MTYIYTPNSLYFVTYKTYHSQNYFDSIENKEILQSQILTASSKFNVTVVAYAILSNHYHLLIDVDESESQMTKFLQQVNGGTSFRISKPSHVQSIWEPKNKYSRLIMGEKAMFQVIGYVVGNPLKHGIAKDFHELDDYNYCNYSEICEAHGREMINNLVLENCELPFSDSSLIEKVYFSEENENPS
jgi:putative transposase